MPMGRGDFLVKDDGARRRFHAAVRGMTKYAIARVKEMQPYNSGDKAPQDGLGIVATLDNADKHRQIISLRPGLEDTTAVLTIGQACIYSKGVGFRYDGTEVGHFDFTTVDPHLWPQIESETNVEVRGSFHVSMEVVDVKGYVDALELRRSLAYLREQIVPALESHVRPR